jgi:Lsr2
MTPDQDRERVRPGRGVDMARRTVFTLEDDLDGSPADETLRFGVDGSQYEIDLSSKNAAKLHKLLAPFVERARKAGSSAHRPARTAASRRRSRDIREWARAQGIELSDRGRIPSSVVDKYEAAANGSGRRQTAGTRRRHGLPERRASAISRLASSGRCWGRATSNGIMPFAMGRTDAGRAGLRTHPRPGMPAERGAEPGGHVGEDLQVVLTAEGERERERHLRDLPERGVRV